MLPELGEVLAATWPYPADAITVVDGATDGIARMLEQVVSYGDRVVLESPGFPPFFDLIEAGGRLDGELARLLGAAARRARGPAGRGAGSWWLSPRSSCASIVVAVVRVSGLPF